MSSERFVVEWRSENGMEWVRHLDGVPWADAPAPPKRHEHWAQTWARFNFETVDRCPCGAMRRSSWPEWMPELGGATRVGPGGPGPIRWLAIRLRLAIAR